MKRKAVNWSNLSKDDLYNVFWKQMKTQLWYPEAYAPFKDKSDWARLTDIEREVFKKVLVQLTGLDTEQGGEGMNLIGVHEKNLHAKSIISFINMMEAIHAQSYSNIFTSLIDDAKEREELFKWYENHEIVQKKANTVVEAYRRLLTPNPTRVDLYMAKVYSVLLESFMFYSGFFFPLYLAGTSRMGNSAEIIFAILKDEALHGSFVGIQAQYEYQNMSFDEQEEADKLTEIAVDELFELESAYTEEIYKEIGLVDDVIEFLKYNLNKALANLGLEPKFEDVNVNPIVMNGIDTETKNHDFFSKTGSYVVSTEIVPVQDDDFKALELMLNKGE